MMTFYLAMISILVAVCIFYCFKVIRCEEENEELKAELDRLKSHKDFIQAVTKINAGEFINLNDGTLKTRTADIWADGVKPSKPEAEPALKEIAEAKERAGVFAEGVVKTGSWWGGCLPESEIKRESHKKQKHKKKKPKA